MKDRNPWWWIPTLYFAEGIPYFIVNNISVIMFNNMGMSKGDMAWYTSMLYLPWVIKPIWSPFVDIIKTKRWWVVAMQVIMSAASICRGHIFGYCISISIQTYSCDLLDHRLRIGDS